MIFLILHIRRTKRFWPVSRKISSFLRHCTGAQMIAVQLLTSSWVSHVLIASGLKQLVTIKTVNIFSGQNGPLPVYAILGIQTCLALEYTICKT